MHHPRLLPQRRVSLLQQAQVLFGGLLHLVVLDLVGPDDLAQFRAEILILNDPLLLSKLLLPAEDPALKQPPLPHAAVQVGL